MEVPQRLLRFSTNAAQSALSQRFNLPKQEWMQDWEYIVSDSDRIDEFLMSYEGGELSDDEKFSLMELILDSFRVLEEFDPPSPRWQQTLDLIEQNIELHAYTVCYWASLDAEEKGVDVNDPEYAWPFAPAMRVILNRHRLALGFPPHDV